MVAACLRWALSGLRSLVLPLGWVDPWRPTRMRRCRRAQEPRQRPPPSAEPPQRACGRAVAFQAAFRNGSGLASEVSRSARGVRVVADGPLGAVTVPRRAVVGGDLRCRGELARQRRTNWMAGPSQVGGPARPDRLGSPATPSPSAYQAAPGRAACLAGRNPMDWPDELAATVLLAVEWMGAAAYPLGHRAVRLAAAGGHPLAAPPPGDRLAIRSPDHRRTAPWHQEGACAAAGLATAPADQQRAAGATGLEAACAAAAPALSQADDQERARRSADPSSVGQPPARTAIRPPEPRSPSPQLAGTVPATAPRVTAVPAPTGWPAAAPAA